MDKVLEAMARARRILPELRLELVGWVLEAEVGEKLS